MKNIKIDLSKKIKNYDLFLQTVEHNVNKIPKTNQVFDDSVAEYYTSPEFLYNIDGDIPNAEATGLFEFQFLNRNLIQFLLQVYPNHSIVPSGWFHYPKGGFMSWHTNSNIKTKRVYVVYADEDHESFFRFKYGNDIITDYDNKGVTIREFDTREELLWHCVYSNCNRYSFGFRIQDMS